MSLVDGHRRQTAVPLEGDAHAVGALDGRPSEQRDKPERGIDRHVVGLRADTCQVGGEIDSIAADRERAVVGPLRAQDGDTWIGRLESDAPSQPGDVEDPPVSAETRHAM